MKNELKNIFSGKGKVRYGDSIQTITSYLIGSKNSSQEGEPIKSGKSKEAKLIEKYCDETSFWVKNIQIENFVSSGAEQRVFLLDEFRVIKLNDGIYYESWLDYLYNLLLHNFFFPDTAYQLTGFYQADEVLYAVVAQQFVKSDSPTVLENVKLFLAENGFNNNRNNDYLNPELGIILEDLHDENVLTSKGNLFFIDTVFYLTGDFFKKK